MGDQRQRIWSNLLMGYGGRVAMITITAPGQDYLPWDRENCRHRADERCSGDRGCTVAKPYADRWNRAADKLWSRLHDAAAATVRRKHGPGALALLAYSCERQKRGVLHWHVLVGIETARERAAAHHYVNNLSRLAPAYAFGHVDRGHRGGHRGSRRLREMQCWEAASYSSKYLVKWDGAGGIGSLVLDGTAPCRPVYVANRLTSKTRCTMRVLRLRRALWVVTGQHHAVSECELLWGLVRDLGARPVAPDVLGDGEVSNAP